jgi:predicted membrane channel-forming protein YqfA (hemolysin III family)
VKRVRLTARVFSYTSAILLAVGGVMPWLSAGSEPGGASVLGISVVWALAVFVVLATAMRRRVLLALAAVAAALFAVGVLWTVPHNPFTSAPNSDSVTASGGGLVVIIFGAMLLYAASWLPAPTRRADSPEPAG